MTAERAEAPTTQLWQRLAEEDREPGYRFGTRRAATPAATLGRIVPLARQAGLTRLANLTDLDWIGIPVYQAICPNARLYSVTQGKGLTHQQAKISALMEVLEQFHAEQIGLPTVRETVGAMRRQIAYDPYALPLSQPTLLNDAMPLDWLPATDLWNGSSTWVPRPLCDLDSTVEERQHLPLFSATSNGLAGGNTVGEALLHGLCEVIERDAVWRAERLGRFSDLLVGAETIASRLGAGLVERLARAGVTALIGDASGPTGLPCFQAWIDHPDGPIVAWGSGCHPDRTTALVRALTEAAQARVTYISGARDDVERRSYRPGDARPSLQGYLPAPGRGRRFEDAPSLRPRPLAEQVTDLAHRIRLVTGMSPLAVDLTRPDVGLPIVFVVAPGLKVSAH